MEYAKRLALIADQTLQKLWKTGILRVLILEPPPPPPSPDPSLSPRPLPPQHIKAIEINKYGILHYVAVRKRRREGEVKRKQVHDLSLVNWHSFDCFGRREYLCPTVHRLTSSLNSPLENSWPWIDSSCSVGSVIATYFKIHRCWAAFVVSTAQVRERKADRVFRGGQTGERLVS